MNITQSTTQSRKGILLTSLRTILYGGLVAALAEFMKWDASQFMGMDKFTEASYTESLQATFLILSSALLLIHFIKKNSYVALLILALTAASTVREFDDFFDSIFNGAWEFTAFSIIIIVLITIYKNKEKFFNELSLFLNTSAFGIFSFGLFTTYIFSRLFGRSAFWKVVMEEKYFRSVKNTGEECIELYGYLLILIAIIEFTIFTKKEVRA